MKNKTNLLLVSLVICIGLFIYLTIHHFQVQLGTNGPNICSVSSKINCDAAAMSPYSEIAKIPVSVLGLAFSLVMFFLVLFDKFQWSDSSPEKNSLFKILFLASALISVVMALLSFFAVKVICPFCLLTYVFSFLNLYLAWSLYSSSKFDINQFLTSKFNWSLAAIFVVTTWFISSYLQNQYGLDMIKKYIPEKVQIWKNAPVVQFDLSLGLNQNTNAENTIIEFADFKCPHCKDAAENIHNFLSTRKDVRFVFKPFPLDGTCNPQISQKGDGSRCKMAAWSLCAEKLFQKGWEVHKYYFDNQEDLFSVTDLKETNQNISKKLNFNYDEVEKCSDSAETNNSIAKMSNEGLAGGVQGTPTVFLNSKKVEFGHGQLNLILKTLLDQK